jgi:hypothetical protein
LLAVENPFLHVQNIGCFHSILGRRIIDGLLECFEERCAILEFDADIERSLAERTVAEGVLAESKLQVNSPPNS